MWGDEIRETKCGGRNVRYEMWGTNLRDEMLGTKCKGQNVRDEMWVTK